MKPELSSTAVTQDSPLPSAQRASPASTVPLSRDGDPAERALAQVDDLAASLKSSHHADEECLESYLQQYMQRLTGKSQKELPSAPVATELTVPAGVPKEEEIAEHLPTPAPEQRNQLVAMRALANDSARRAVAESSNVLRIVRMRRAYFEAKAASIASTTLAIAFFATRSTIALSSAALLFGAALVLSYRFLRIGSAQN